MTRGWRVQNMVVSRLLSPGNVQEYAVHTRFTHTDTHSHAYIRCRGVPSKLRTSTTSIDRASSTCAPHTAKLSRAPHFAHVPNLNCFCVCGSTRVHTGCQHWPNSSHCPQPVASRVFDCQCPSQRHLPCTGCRGWGPRRTHLVRHCHPRVVGQVSHQQ